ENVYPAEIERVLLADPRVGDAVVVRRPDAKWGEVPVAVVARNDERLTAEELYARCRRELAGYKQPRDIRFVAFAALPRSTTGKIQRHEVEAWLRRTEQAEVQQAGRRSPPVRTAQAGSGSAGARGGGAGAVAEAVDDVVVDHAHRL